MCNKYEHLYQLVRLGRKVVWWVCWWWDDQRLEPAPALLLPTFHSPHTRPGQAQARSSLSLNLKGKKSQLYPWLCLTVSHCPLLVGWGWPGPQAAAATQNGGVWRWVCLDSREIEEEYNNSLSATSHYSSESSTFHAVCVITAKLFWCNRCIIVGYGWRGVAWIGVVMNRDS